MIDPKREQRQQRADGREALLVLVVAVAIVLILGATLAVAIYHRWGHAVVGTS
jgi:hypothetical protein